MDEAEGYAASLRQMAQWIVDGDHADVDECELTAAAEFIERQRALIAKLAEERHVSWWLTEGRGR